MTEIDHESYDDVTLERSKRQRSFNKKKKKNNLKTDSNKMLTQHSAVSILHCDIKRHVRL